MYELYKSVTNLYQNTTWEYRDCMWAYKDYLELTYPELLDKTRLEICWAICAKCNLEISDDCDLCYWNTYEEDSSKEDKW